MAHRVDFIPQPPWCPVAAPATGPFMAITDPMAPCRNAVPGVGLGDEELSAPPRCRLAFSAEWERIGTQADPFSDVGTLELRGEIETLVSRKGWALVVPSSDPCYKPFKPGAGYTPARTLLFVKMKNLTPIWSGK